MTPIHDPQRDRPFDFGMTEIEEGLRTDDDGSFRARLLDRLDGSAAEIGRRLAAGVSPQEFTNGNAILRALAAAKEIVILFPKN